MASKSDSLKKKLTEDFYEFSQLSDYSFMNYLNADPQSTKDGNDHKPRSVYSGHYVPVVPTAIPEPEYVSHSNELFKELESMIFCNDLKLFQIAGLLRQMSSSFFAYFSSGMTSFGVK